jgi:hypothetical protein
MNLCEQILYHAHGGGEKETTTRQGPRVRPSALALPASHGYTSQNENRLSS